ncbi:hypothetical protein SERLA73DRAFT_190414 [Serpula lacrymans var. lacrymans S7.3]|uniref:RING-type domain-containing protein n=2 Tax=Serpula lacrymans var. lacrymans TaxID=341189 RepID=F8QFM1_SERL3|nr:uncharacterized protein SERLADRAFT_457769 [Serpula lacrymans var. lacrymans S7.9]EGN92855.1 hypothetical protein SERLA73DRAFT_190414 [Serpula lacrymans var. lacrymans S7.3]EGO29688.1 hypothetical protein SERLADRAFT_457769 [Serpula lacrymans var. lacrymans S7.9]
MASISTWYHNQYSTWNRTRRLHAPTFLARTDTNASRTAAAMARTGTQEPVVINMGEMNDTTNKENKKQDTLFGPSIGVINSGPKWTQSCDKKAADQLSPEIVKSWMTKVKEASQPTTTLQALVNLKRPTLRLSPLAMSSTDDSNHDDSHHHHGLEFEYDCDAPKCGIYVHVILPSDHPLVENHDSSGLSRILIFETTVEGGFGKILKLEEGATLELGRFEQRSHQPTPVEDVIPTSKAPSEIAAEPAGENEHSEGNTRNDHGRRRFAPFHFRKRTHDRAISGPALAVVDAEVSSAEEDGKDKESKEDSDEGVRVTIRLVALDEDGFGLSSPNEQITYIHVVRLGAGPVDEEEDHRPWVVRVVKREAKIGPHIFHLHEIYGLSSQSTASSQPQAASPTSTQTHTYPPTAPPSVPLQDDEPSSECLLCLSSPREVILLPCRHLVACKECAINMVEFGAGGNIVHAEDTAAAASGGTDGNTADATAGGDSAPPSILPTTNQNRRKRKAKGWFCPVCRQPYTSLLRISTTPPAKEMLDGGHNGSASLDESEEATSDQEPDEADIATATATSGGMLNTLRSGILRNISLSAGRGDNPSANESATSATPTLPRDVERGLEPTAAA